MQVSHAIPMSFCLVYSAKHHDFCEETLGSYKKKLGNSISQTKICLFSIDEITSKENVVWMFNVCFTPTSNSCGIKSFSYACSEE
jgi:hypothetical protein